ncbi:hydrogenase maturation protease [Streptomyces sp. AK02-01A]|nr:hydrogenase maturation protease [Streptomyces sp. AK02-01A]MDX3850109.1 hydrogenase maturation protease [Streptomyces sp. AK02-01A]
MDAVPLPDSAPDAALVGAPGSAPGRTLVAGIGNIFLGDDGFGVEAVRLLTGRPLPSGVDLMDAGIRGIHLAYRLLDGYRRLVLVDTVDRGVPPGTVCVIDVDPLQSGPASTARLDGHGMDPAAVLCLVRELHAQAGGTLPEQVLVVGCQPLTAEEGIGLSEPVAAAVGPAAELVLDLVRRPPGTALPTDGSATARDEDEGDELDELDEDGASRQGTGSDMAVGLRRSGRGRDGVRNGEVRTGPAPLSADAPDVTAEPGDGARRTGR